SIFLCHILFFLYFFSFFFFFNDSATTEIYTLSLHDALPISLVVFLDLARDLRFHPSDDQGAFGEIRPGELRLHLGLRFGSRRKRSEEHTSELQSRGHLVCRLLLEKKKKKKKNNKENIKTKSE